MRTPNYVINCDMTISTDMIGIQKVLPAGSFVRPIERTYVPKHVLVKYKDSSSEYYEFCYCYYGIIPVPKSYLRQI